MTYVIQKDQTKGTMPALPTMAHLEENNILPTEQKRNKREIREGKAKHRLLIDKIILENCKNQKKKFAHFVD